MQICKDHWAKIKKRLDDAGLSHVGAKSGAAAMQDMKDQLAGIPTDYDPYMDCNWMISNQALEMGGLYLMTLKEDGSSYCPVCEAVAHAPPDLPYDVETEWIEGPTNAAIEHARKLGLIPGKQ